MTLNRAYSTLEIKSTDTEQRIITGVASSPVTDRQGDVILTSGAKFALPLPLLWQHNHKQPIGHVLAAEVTEDGIRIRAQIAKGVLPYIDEAWSLIKSGLVRGLSIGFRPLEEPEPIKGTWGFKFSAWEWLELSAVTIPANQDASIASIKSIVEREDQAASGNGRRVVSLTPAGVTAPLRESSRSSKSMTTGEQIAAFEAKRAANAARMNEIMKTASDEGRSTDESERDEFDGLETEVETIDGDLRRLKALDKFNQANATPANGNTPKAASQSRGGDAPSFRVSAPKLEPGIGFARAMKAMVVATKDHRQVMDVAKEMYPSDDRLHAHVQHTVNLPHIMRQIKAAIPAATTTHADWASALMDPTNLAGEFIEFLRPATIIGRLNLRNIPFNVRMIEQTQGGVGYWVGQGAPKPLTAFGYAPVTLGPTKVAAIVVLTEESVRLSTPNLDMLARDGLRDALVARIDQDLLNPAEAGVANIQPASLTNGLTALTSAGTSADNIRTDIANLVQVLRGANLRGPIVLVMPDSLATAAAFMANSLGQPEFPDLTSEGGSIRGIRVITSEYLANQSGAGNMVVAIAEREVFLADDGSVRIDASGEASLEMLDNPTNNSATPTPTTMVSMFQTDSIALRAERWINWLKRRDDAVAYIDDVNWGSIGSP